MSVFERFASRRSRETLDVTPRVTCVRCRREYTPDPDAQTLEDHCWWCSARVSSSGIPIVTE
jgi:hypothetical protein